MVKGSFYPIRQKIHYNAQCWLDSAADSGVYCPLVRPFLFLCQTHEPRRSDGAPATVLLWLGGCLCRLAAEPHHVWGGRFVGYYVQAHCRAVSLGPRDGFGGLDDQLDHLWAVRLDVWSAQRPLWLARGDDCRRPPLYRWDGADEPDPVAVAAVPVLWGGAGGGPVGSRGAPDCPGHEVVRAEPGLGPRCRPVAECRVCRVCPLVRLPVGGVWVARHLSLARARRLAHYPADAANTGSAHHCRGNATLSLWCRAGARSAPAGRYDPQPSHADAGVLDSQFHGPGLLHLSLVHFAARGQPHDRHRVDYSYRSPGRCHYGDFRHAGENRQRLAS